MLVDNFAMGAICAILFFIGTAKGYSETNDIFDLFLSFIALSGFALGLVKDFNSRSIGKRVFDLIVKDVRTGIAASPLKCLIRNLSLILWPVDIIVLLINHERRLGDFIAGTVVVSYDPYSPYPPKSNPLQTILSFLIAITIVYIFTLPFQ